MTYGIELAPGTRVGQRYRILGELGAGGMAIVYEALDEPSRARVALKIMRGSEDSRLRQRFLHEARACMRLASPFVVRLLDAGHHHERHPYLVFERLYGVELARELSTRTVAISEVVDWILDACEGLAHAHAHGIVHRDIKPSNLFICDHPDRRYMKILDFGVAKAQGDVPLTGNSEVLGTLGYISPEQAKGSPATHFGDQFALAVVLYEAIAGHKPFRGLTPAECALALITRDPPPLRSPYAAVPAALEAIVRRALAKFPDQRFASHEDFARALSPFGSQRRAKIVAIDDDAPPASETAPMALGRKYGRDPAD